MTIKKLKDRGIQSSVLESGRGWVRNPSWLPLAPLSPTDQKMTGVVAVYPESSFLAVRAIPAYTIDWGDGTIQNTASNVVTGHLYDYNDPDLDNTNAPVTLTDSGDLVTRTAHGYIDNMTVSFYNIVSTTGLNEGQTYYVINATADTFQVSSSPYGSAIPLTTNGTATLLPYKQAIVTLTTQSGNLTTLNLNVKNTQASLSAYDAGYLDVEISAPNVSASALTIGGSTTRLGMMERIAIRSTGASLSGSNLFQYCYKLQEIIWPISTSVTSASSMFSGCNSMTKGPAMNTSACTTMSSMFSTCSSLVSVPMMDTSSATNMSNMFTGCNSLVSVPMMDTSSVTNMSNMFATCNSLVSVPMIDTSSVTNMSGMFSNCVSLVSVPMIDTSSATNMSNMFSGCNSLEFLPPLNTSECTTMTSFVYSCSSLKSFPLINMSKVLTCDSMFGICTSLQVLPLLNTSSATSITGIFSSCPSLSSLPALNFSSVGIGGAASAFGTLSNCYSFLPTGLRYSFSVTGMKLSTAAINTMMDGLGTAAASQTVTIGTQWGVDNQSKTGVTTTNGSPTLTMSTTANLVAGMEAVGSNTTDAQRQVGIDVALDTVNSPAAFNVQNGDPVRFTNVDTVTGISISTTYYVRDSGFTSPNYTFKLATTKGGAAINLGGSNTSAAYINLPNIILSVDSGTQVTMSGNSTGSGSISIVFSNVQRWKGRLKGWTVSG